MRNISVLRPWIAKLAMASAFCVLSTFPAFAQAAPAPTPPAPGTIGSPATIPVDDGGGVILKGEGRLKICKVAGLGVTIGTPFTFHVYPGNSTVTVLAGPAPGGNCAIGPSFFAGIHATVVEQIPPGYTVSSITVAPSNRLVSGPSLPNGSVTVTVGPGVTEVTYTNQRTGFIEICKQGDVRGNFTFYVTPGNLGPFVVPAGGCSPAIEVPAGNVTIHEAWVSNAAMVGCSTLPSNRQGPCNPAGLTSTVSVPPGDVSTQTIAIITNRLRSPIDPPDTQTNNPN